MTPKKVSAKQKLPKPAVMPAHEAYTEDDFLAEMAKDCRNCPCCQDVPCAGCCAGGMCDAFECRREDPSEDDEYDSEDDGAE